MWICARCQTENRDSAAACERCGAARAAGRFAPADRRRESAARPPRIRVSAPMPGAEPAPPVAAYRQPEPETLLAPPRRPGARFARAIGGALCVLLPLLTALLAWRQYDAIAGTLTSLFLSDGAAEGGKLLCYLGLTLVALLLSLLPGLWTLLLAGPRSHKNRE